MKERPILFQGAMVRALLAGTKTQTRRAVRFTGAQQSWLRDPSLYLQRMYGTSPPPNPVDFGKPGLWRIVGPDYPDGEDDNVWCPYGAPGDRLWVRESTKMRYLPNFLTGEPTNAECGEYVADGEPVLNEHEFDIAWWYSRKTCPGIHMPRWASRITLEITAVRVERLQSISEADANAEGCDLPATDQDWSQCRRWYRDLWDSINGTGSWDANPWVWVVEFRRLTA